jgi:hypothetical protein
MLILNSPDYMVPVPEGGFGDLTNLPGLSGQGAHPAPYPPFTPLEKVFDYHFIVRVPMLDGSATMGNQFYDPSYGVTYPSDLGFEQQAIAGYAYAFGDGVGRYRVFTPIPGVLKIEFTPINSQSM